MKKLQNNYTTPEQSKRLLELGVPENSADCAMFPYDETFEQYELRVVPFNKGFSTYEIYNEDGTIYPGKTPCWSVGRLIEIYCTCRECTWEYITNNPPIEDILCDIELHIDELNFSKLEK